MREEKKQEIMYIDIKIYSMVLIVSLLGFILSTVFFNMNNNLSVIVIRFMYIIGSISILLITKSIYTENGGGFFKYIIILYAFLALENIRGMMFFGENALSHNILNYNRIIGDNIFNYVSALTYCSLAKYFSGKKTHFKASVIFGFIAFVFGLIANKLNYAYKGAAFIAFLTIILCVYIFSVFYSFPLVKKNEKEYKEINFFKVGIVNIFIIAVTSIIYAYNVNKSFKIILITIIGIFFFVNFMVNCCCVLYRVLSNPYMFMFDELYDNTLLLKNLNEEVEQKNTQLEKKQLIINKKNSSFKGLFMYIPVPLIILNSRNNRILYSNEHFNTMINRKVKDIVNKKITNLIVLENDKDITINEKIKRGTFIVNEEKKYVDIEMINNSYDSSKILIFTDVTSKVLSDNLQEELDNRIFEERMKSDFLSNISHDLKIPINVIYSAMQLINSDIKNNNYSRVKKYNDVSKNNCEVLNNFTNVLINGEKKDLKYSNFEKSYENIANIIKNVVLSMQDYTEIKNITLNFLCSNDEVIYYCNKQSMQRIIMNLISNSIKYCQVKGNINVSLNDYKDEIVILVKDNGIGMDKDFLKRAFERYSMGDNNKLKKMDIRGSGIGLFIVKNMVEEQNGTIDISSKINEGTCIKIIFKKES